MSGSREEQSTGSFAASPVSDWCASCTTLFAIITVIQTRTEIELHTGLTQYELLIYSHLTKTGQHPFPHFQALEPSLLGISFTRPKAMSPDMRISFRDIVRLWIMDGLNKPTESYRGHHHLRGPRLCPLHIVICKRCADFGPYSTPKKGHRLREHLRGTVAHAQP